MARLLEYENYKDLNGVKIPDSWELSKVKHLGNYLNGFAFKPTHWTDKGIPIIRIQNLTNQDADINRTSFIAPERYHVFKGDILISWSATLDVYIWQKEEAWLNQHIYKVKVNRNKIIEKYFYWTAKWFMGELNESSHGSTMQHLTTDKFGSFNVPLPPISEQHLITNFLDYETAQIDTLIKKQQTLIQLLKEKRQAVISHAVTKGLNPDAPMKGSGVEWLGEVPEHWEVTRIKYITSMFEQGWSPQCDSRPATSDEYGVLKVGCVNYGSFHSIENKALPPELQPRLQYLIEKRDLLISRANTKELVGSAAVVDQDYNNLLLCDKLYRLRFNSNIQPELIALYLSIEPVREQIELQASGASSSMQNISQDIIKELPCFLLPNEEAHELLDYINEKMKVFDNLVSEAQKAIQLMQERRTALISAAVTGKIDVRGWVAPDI
ncbi:restriction endonuclease subunit S [Psychrobacter sp. UBA3068]|uniref:restriction endonuclease subunit S n=1 Tax=Psychrobacter sp. UBA3068 TaxID=1947349 RepID=UPI0025809FA0|nr:restriction endonuclease subunit S [Psychrobacter sp. UBA3068]